jgi:type IV pilus assembly protein PilY1
MLHALDGSSPLTSPTSGREIMAYVPAATFAGPSSPSTPNVDGLAALGNPAYLHRNYVNASPMSFDVDMAKTWNGSAIGSGAPDWRTILVGGMGKGGRSYFALDITDPDSVTTEAIAASKVLWEFTAPEMGYTFGEAIVAKTKKYGWTVILPSGYNTSDGRAYLFFVHPLTGALLEKVTINEGTLASELGLAHINGYVLNYADGVIDAVYGGDLRGNLWRLDVTGTAAYPAPEKIATLTDANGNGQPVTTRPLMELHPKTRERVVLVGTGRMLDQTDINSTQRQSFYAIKDGNQLRFNSTANLPGGATFPLSRSQLVQQPDLLSAIVPTATQQMGWFFDFDLGPNNVAWRLVTDPSPFFGLVAIAPTLPSIEDPCNPSGSSRVYVMDFLTGKTVLKSGTNDLNYVAPTTGVITDLRFLSVSGKPALIAGTDKGEVVKIDFDTTSMLGLRRTNWRELNIGN